MPPTFEDRRDAREEYSHELNHERIHYIEEMAERGYRMGQVIFVDWARTNVPDRASPIGTAIARRKDR